MKVFTVTGRSESLNIAYIIAAEQIGDVMGIADDNFGLPLESNEVKINELPLTYEGEAGVISDLSNN